MKASRLSVVVTAFLLAACARETTPTATSESDLASLGIDQSVGATTGQASLPGFTMAPDPTYQGNVGPAEQCTYSPASGRVECLPVTREGLTFTRSIAFYDAAGAPQPHRDDNTRSTNTQVSVKGTTTTPQGTHTVDRSSSLTVAGLGKTSTQHVLNGNEQGTTTRSVTTDKGPATVTESFTSTGVNIVVNAPFTASTWPASGTMTRSSTITATRGGETHTSTSSELVTYNGTSTVTVTITRDGKARNCTRDLTTHKTTCP